jgi:glutamate decarboxylase
MVLSHGVGGSDESVHSTFASRYVRTSLPRHVASVLLRRTGLPNLSARDAAAFVIDLLCFGRPGCRFRMAEQSIPKEAAYQIINDELMLDGNPRLNLASFVTTWMEPECDKLIQASVNKNYVDMDEYPVTTELQVQRFFLRQYIRPCLLDAACLGMASAR